MKYPQTTQVTPIFVTTNNQKKVYYVNRATAYSKIKETAKSLQDATKAIELDSTYLKVQEFSKNIPFPKKSHKKISTWEETNFLDFLGVKFSTWKKIYSHSLFS